MNKEYIKEIFNEYQQNFINSGLDMETPNDLEDFMKSILISSVQSNFDANIDIDKLLNVDRDIKVKINNNGILKLRQNESDKARGGITLEYINSKDQVYERALIDEGDFVMLTNYYRYIKDYDIYDDFINRDGTNKRDEYNLENNEYLL